MLQKCFENSLFLIFPKTEAAYCEPIPLSKEQLNGKKVRWLHFHIKKNSIKLNEKKKLDFCIKQKGFSDNKKWSPVAQ